MGFMLSFVTLIYQISHVWNKALYVQTVENQKMKILAKSKKTANVVTSHWNLSSCLSRCLLSRNIQNWISASFLPARATSPYSRKDCKMIELLGSNNIFVLLTGLLCLTGLGSWNLQFWRNAKLESRCFHEVDRKLHSSAFLLRCHGVCDTEVTANTNISMKTNVHVQA